MYNLKYNLTDQGLFVTTRGGADSLAGVVDAAVDMVFQKHMKLVGVKPNAADFFQLSQLIESGAIKPHVSKTFSLEDLNLAHRPVEEDSFTGKSALEI